MDTIKSLGARIIELRKKNGISREELAKEFDIPYTTLRNYENGLREPGHVFLVKVALKFHVTTDYLLGVDNKRKYHSHIRDLRLEKGFPIKGVADALEIPVEL